MHVLVRGIQPGQSGEQVVDVHVLGDVGGETGQVFAHRVGQPQLAPLRQLQDGHRAERLARGTEAERGALVVADPPLLVGHAVTAREHGPASVRQHYHAGELALGGQPRNVPVVGAAGPGVRRDPVVPGRGGGDRFGVREPGMRQGRADGCQPAPLQ
ncbi:hypothetical protein GCM10012284_31160 [Mangrovihabitans endophyticus]|uniref:Uncharacterized protein n=1 Tax=Mangrovihabitans endophyticus TaxID=1751298 RepID=A0A8J3FNP1_9ACTN|nr:hypothetical protein GCM10012284_31160 [Mangrovihabitans endophyticus]